MPGSMISADPVEDRLFTLGLLAPEEVRGVRMCVRVIESKRGDEAGQAGCRYFLSAAIA
jgi:hypothetical protein